VINPLLQVRRNSGFLRKNLGKKTSPMQKILIFTDLHIREVGKTIIGIETLERFAEGWEHALQHHPDAARIVLMGDLTNSGKIAEYIRLKPLLDACPIPVSLMVGNHDNRDNLLTVLPDTPTSDGFLQSVADVGDTRLIMLDTLDGPPFRNDHHSGLLCETRLNWFKAALEGARDRRVLVFSHHPAFAVGLDGMDEIRLSNDRAFLDLVKQHPNVAHIFTGHLHRTISGNVEGISFSVFKSPAQQTPLVLKGLDASMSSGEPGAYGLALLYPNAVIVHTEDFQLAEENVQPCRDALPE